MHAHFLLIMVALLMQFYSAGCSSQPPELQSVHGQPVSHWLEQLKQTDAKLRRKAVIALQGVGNTDPAAIPAITGALKDSDATVRDAAVLALLNIGPDAHDASGTLGALKNDQDANVRLHVAKALARVQVDSSK